MKPIDIVPADLEIVRQILQDFVPEIEVRAFGSRVTWSARETSDLDLALMTDDRLPDSCSMNLREAFSESELPFKVDLIDWATTSDNFRKVIDREYVVVQGMKKGTSTNRECWIEKRFGECAILVRDTVSPSNAQKSLYIGLEHIKESALHLSGYGMASDVTSIKTRFQCGDILFGKLRPYFRKAVVAPFDGVCSTDIWVVRPAYNIDANFLFYWMASQEFVDMATQGAEGTRMPRAKWEYVSRIKKSIPPLAEQRAIAHILGALDDKIKLNRQTNETLEAIARALFKSWFVDFDPVRVNMEGRQPAGISPELAALFPDSFEDSELGEIPKGWSIAPIGDLVRVIGGATPSTKEPKFWKGGEYCWATPKDLSGVAEPVLVDTNKHITDEGVAKISSGLLPPGTVLLSSRAPIGYLAITQVPTAVNQGFIAMVCDGELPNLYILYWCEQSMPSILAKSGGTTFDEITKKNFRPMPVTIPSTDVLDAYTKQIDTIHKRIVSNVHESSNLAAHRDNLLPKLVSGEIRLTEAETAVETVV